ncbi:MAG: hypothetical protein K1X88_21860 [Nannocystaceae bacterium]|nr:hypothetical protein [Nannocystaceae bacterium]
MIALGNALLAGALASPPGPAITVQVADDDGTAAAELGALVERHGAQGSPAMRLEAPPQGLSRADAARQRCAQGGRAVFWLDAARTDEWRLYAQPCDGRLLVREIVVTPGAEQAALEAAWLILRGSAIAIVEGHEVAMHEAPAEPTPTPVRASTPATTTTAAPAKTAAPPPRRAIGLRLSLAYAGEPLAAQLPWRSGLFGGIGWTPRRRLRIGAWYEWLAPGHRDQPAGFAVWQHAIALWAAGVLPIAKRLALELRGGPELVIARWRSDALGRSRPRPIARIGADATLQIALTRVLALDVGAGLAVSLADVDYITCAAGSGGDPPPCSGADRRVTVDAWRVRPRARAGFSVQF